MKLIQVIAAGVIVIGVPMAAWAQIPQERPSVGKYLTEGYEVLRVEIGNPFLQFILKKEQALVWCSVHVQTGETSSCRTIK